VRNHSDQRRMFLALLSIMACFIALALRLMWIQIGATTGSFGQQTGLAQQSVAQRRMGIVLDNGRGDFYDRNMLPLTGHTIRALAVFPFGSNADHDDGKIRELTRILRISLRGWEDFTSGLNEPKFWKNNKKPEALTAEQAEQIRSLHLPNVRVLNVRLRYLPDSVARHLIGFTGQNQQLFQDNYAGKANGRQRSVRTPVGVAGLERTFETFVGGGDATTLSWYVDGRRRPMNGLAARVSPPQNPYYPLKVVTTIDLDVQRHIESLLDSLAFPQGAVVVLDAATSDVIAMVSRPQYDPYDIHPDRQNWGNRALKAIIPGSVFKTVVAAAALETKAVKTDETFECRGELGQYGFACWKKDGHGRLTLAEAFAESCNIAFAQVMRKLSSSRLEETAWKLGLGNPVGWTGKVAGNDRFRQFDAEEGGSIFSANAPKDDDGVKIQTAIGQRDVRMTPLQAANMVAALLQKGTVKAPRVVKEVRYQDGRLMMSFPEKVLVPKHSGISEKTAKTLLGWMEAVVSEGTGKALRDAEWKLAGKTGTAQVAAGNRGVVNQWFVGYGPVDSPRYVVAVAAENMPENEKNIALPAFLEVMNILAGLQGKSGR